MPPVFVATAEAKPPFAFVVALVETDNVFFTGDLTTVAFVAAGASPGPSDGGMLTFALVVSSGGASDPGLKSVPLERSTGSSEGFGASEARSVWSLPFASWS